MEEVTPTSQSQEKNPPPPSPLPPIVVPNDRIIEFEVDLGTSALQIETRGEDADVQEGASDRAAASRVPDTSARLLRAVQPAYPSAAQDNEIKARVVVEVDVNAAGQVTDAHVTKRWILTNDAERPTSQLGYGLEAAALAAARRSLFRPAQFNGEPVSTRTALTFTFGH